MVEDLVMITSRRSLFGFGAALIAAPAIVRVSSLMAISPVRFRLASITFDGIDDVIEINPAWHPTMLGDKLLAMWEAAG